MDALVKHTYITFTHNTLKWFTTELQVIAIESLTGRQNYNSIDINPFIKYSSFITLVIKHDPIFTKQWTQYDIHT